MPFCDDDVKKNFRIKGFIQKSFTLIRTNLHQDEADDGMCKDDLEKIFLGNPFRALFNLEGEPTRFYRDKNKSDVYRLSHGSMAFFHYKKESLKSCEKAAWHRGVGPNTPRAFLVISMQHV